MKNVVYKKADIVVSSVVEAERVKETLEEIIMIRVKYPLSIPLVEVGRKKNIPFVCPQRESVLELTGNSSFP